MTFQHTATRRRLPVSFRSSSYQHLFQHTAARRRLPLQPRPSFFAGWFQHTAARRRLRTSTATTGKSKSFNTQPPEGGCRQAHKLRLQTFVSTHSHPKAAAKHAGRRQRQQRGFNTQPPEGGCGR